MVKKINQFLNSIFPQQHNWKLIIFERWNSIIGNDLKNKAVIEKIENNLLVIGVCHPALSQELFLNSAELRSKINNLFKKEKIKKIQFRQISKKQFLKKQTHFNDKVINEINEEIPNLTNDEFQLLISIKDKTLKNSLYKFYIRCKRINKN